MREEFSRSGKKLEKLRVPSTSYSCVPSRRTLSLPLSLSLSYAISKRAEERINREGKREIKNERGERKPREAQGGQERRMRRMEERGREIQREKKRREEKGGRGSVGTLHTEDWKTHCLGCTHTGSDGCVTSVKYRRSDSVE